MAAEAAAVTVHLDLLFTRTHSTAGCRCCNGVFLGCSSHTQQGQPHCITPVTVTHRLTQEEDALLKGLWDTEHEGHPHHHIQVKSTVEHGLSSWACICSGQTLWCEYTGLQ